MVDDQFGSPTWARSLAQATADLLRKRELVAQHGGTYHLAASGHVNRYEFAKAIIEAMKGASGDSRGWARLSPIKTGQYPLPARRPPHPVLRMDRVKQAFGIEVPHWREQLHGFLQELAKSTHLGV